MRKTSNILMSIPGFIKLMVWLCTMAIAVGLAWVFDEHHYWLHLVGVWVGTLLLIPAMFWLDSRISGRATDSKQARGRIMIMVLAILIILIILAGLILELTAPTQ